ncbi:cytidine deaminase family protein [Phytoactinopolyspora endophytica]|uniref:cytidine deaminase family protein n=1 Tax=Phytoactinopolyspora endophytica TaxID=1642495 RepID=UPI00101D6283|nr:cytidine deaminase [Phytoactinopolyspora endophytica]
MQRVDHRELIEAAAERLNPHRIEDRVSGDVASVLVTDSGQTYAGVCIDTPCGTGFCAEHSAIAAMVTAREHRISRIVAVWRSDTGKLHVLPPCGRCREFIRQIHPDNLDTDVVLGLDRSAALRDLLPEHEWPDPIGTL